MRTWGTRTILRKIRISQSGTFYLDNFRVWKPDPELGKTLFAAQLSPRCAIVSQPPANNGKVHRQVNAWFHRAHVETFELDPPWPYRLWKTNGPTGNQQELRHYALVHLTIQYATRDHWENLQRLVAAFEPNEIPYPTKRLIFHQLKTLELQAYLPKKNNNAKAQHFQQHGRPIIEYLSDDINYAYEPQTLNHCL